MHVQLMNACLAQPWDKEVTKKLMSQSENLAEQ